MVCVELVCGDIGMKQNFHKTMKLAKRICLLIVPFRFRRIYTWFALQVSMFIWKLVKVDVLTNNQQSFLIYGPKKQRKKTEQIRSIQATQTHTVIYVYTYII